MFETATMIQNMSKGVATCMGHPEPWQAKTQHSSGQSGHHCLCSGGWESAGKSSRLFVRGVRCMFKVSRCLLNKKHRRAWSVECRAFCNAWCHPRTRCQAPLLQGEIIHPPSPMFALKAFFKGGEWGCIFEAPCIKFFIRPPLLCAPHR